MSDILSHITLAKFEHWKGTTRSFIISWQNHFRLHESLIDVNSYFSENQKKIILEMRQLQLILCVPLKIKPISFSHTHANLQTMINTKLVMILSSHLHPLEALEIFIIPNQEVVILTCVILHRLHKVQIMTSMYLQLHYQQT